MQMCVIRHRVACTRVYPLIVQPAEVYRPLTRQPRFQGRALLRMAGIAAGILLLGAAFHGVDLGGSIGPIKRLGWTAAWILVPSMLSLVLEIAAWRLACVRIDSRATYVSLLRARVATEWISNTVPLAAVWAEGLKPALLSRSSGLSIPAGMTTLLARKYLLLASQAAYALAGAICVFPLVSERLGSVHWSVSAAALGLVVLLVFALGESTRLLLGRGAAMTRLSAILSRLPSKRLKRALGQLAAGAQEMDERTAQFFRTPRKELLVPLVFCFAGWLLEATETWLILGLLGASTPWARALGVEALVVLIRHVLVFLPGGLGAQELGYAALLSPVLGGLGVCASFSLLKRLRELCWAALGATLLFTQRATDRSLTASARP